MKNRLISVRGPYTNIRELTKSFSRLAPLCHVWARRFGSCQALKITWMSHPKMGGVWALQNE